MTMTAGLAKTGPAGQLAIAMKSLSSLSMLLLDSQSIWWLCDRLCRATGDLSVSPYSVSPYSLHTQTVVFLSLVIRRPVYPL